jgi:hypothetical protein
MAVNTSVSSGRISTTEFVSTAMSVPELIATLTCARCWPASHSHPVPTNITTGSASLSS